MYIKHGFKVINFVKMSEEMLQCQEEYRYCIIIMSFLIKWKKNIYLKTILSVFRFDVFLITFNWKSIIWPSSEKTRTTYLDTINYKGLSIKHCSFDKNMFLNIIQKCMILPTVFLPQRYTTNV